MMKIEMVVLESKCYPEKAHPTDAGFDLRSKEEEFTLEPGAKRKVGSGVQVDIPTGYVGLVYPRSGLGTKYQLNLANGTGVIDAHYTGEISITLVNNGKVDIKIEQFDRVAQLVIVPICVAQLVPVDGLKNSNRGEKGHGSTGNA